MKSIVFESLSRGD